jgi:hypothetical protein
MNLRDVNWRFALYFGGLLGGIVWAVLAASIISAQDGTGSTRLEITAGTWLLVLAVSVAVLIVGMVTVAIGRSIVLRSTGIGLAVSALAGWVMIAWIALQFLLG